MEGPSLKETIKYCIKPVHEIKQRIKLIAEPVGKSFEEKLKNPASSIILQPYAVQQSTSKLINLQSYTHDVCAWLSCSRCGYLTEDSKALGEHFKNHDEEDVKFLNEIKCEIDSDSFDENDEFIEPEIKTKLSDREQQMPLVDNDPIAVPGSIKFSHQRNKQPTIFKEQNSDLIHLISYKPFRCQCCNYRGSTLKKVDEHMRIHTGERPYRCKTCGYGTRNASALSYHLKTHNENRPFTCNLCNYRNTTLSSLRSHKTRVHAAPLSKK